MRPRVLLAIVALMLCVSATGAAETVWSGLVMANNAPQPTAAPKELTKIEAKLKELFGYNQFQVIGQTTQTLTDGNEGWEATSKYFSLHVNSKGEQKAGYLLNLQLFQEQKLLLETEAKLSKRSPLVIKGPIVGDGQLLLLVLVQ